MPLSAKSAIPRDRDPAAGHWTIDEAAGSGLTLFTAPPGYLLTEGLAAVFERRKRAMVWVRVGPEDGDPGMFLASLIAAAQRRHPGVGRPTLELMRERPGPVAGWPQLFRRLGQELAETLPGGGALVLEDVDHLHRAHPTLALFSRQLLPLLDPATSCILTSHDEVPQGALPEQAVRRSVHDLRLAPAAARESLEHAMPGLPDECVRRAAGLCRGQTAAVTALCATAAMLGSGAIRQAVGRAGSVGQLLALLAEAWLKTLDTDAWRALGLALRLEYSHPALAEAALEGGRPPAGPWLQPLDDGWSRVRTVWRAPLRATLARRGLPSSAAVHRAADYLLQRGAPERAIPLYLELGDTDCGARTIVGEAGQLMDLGQWETLGDWLDRLPDDADGAEPRLLHDRGEIAAARGQADLAERQFSLAASRFTARRDPEGACRSMLAESAIAAGRGDPAKARARALAASALADAKGVPRQQIWASWQLGVLTSVAHELDDALAYFDRAATLALQLGEPASVAFLSETERLARRVQQLHREREAHRQTHAALEQAEHEATERLRAHVDARPGELHPLIGAYGWSQAPPVLKLAAPEPEPAPALDGTGWWSRMRRAFGSRGSATGAHPGAASPDRLPASAPATHEVAPVALPRDARDRSEAPALVVHLFGALRVTLNDVPVDGWPRGRGRSLFEYLLTHRDPWASREMLMEAFWPDSTPESARNSLNVAVHGLRRSLRAAAAVPVVVLHAGTYRLHPEMQLWLDVEEFERHVGGGRELEAAGELPGAMAEYELAASLYQGDFLADDPYEEWPVLTRERLRLAYLDTLDRLSHLYFGHAQYAACANLCQRILERDPCREDAHRRLMRCYSRQGQPHVALRQYRACAEALEAELGVAPAPPTAELHERIRRHEPV